MKHTFTILLLLASIVMADAQFSFGGRSRGPKIKGKITGVVKDSITGETVPFASVSMRRAGSKVVLNGVISEEDGEFKLGEVTPGKYDVIISFLGYEEKVLTNAETTPKDPDLDLGIIQLVESSLILDEVQITEKRALIENKVDKIVFNAEDDSSVAGGDATDVLRKVPLLSVDLDGNVSLRGSQQVQILINGKPSGMFSSNVADALKMFPADQIKKVEVITSPGAKYDGEGSAGIINIITKRSEIRGIAGSINTSIGNRSSNGNFSLNVGSGRFGFTTNGGVFWSLPQDATNSFTRTDLASGAELYSFGGITETERLGFNGSGNAFYDFNAYNSINTNFRLRGFGFDRDGSNSGQFFGQSFDRNTLAETLNSGYDWNTDYTMKFEENDTRQFSVAVGVTGNISDQESLITETGFTSREETVLNDADNVEITGQIDYVHPVGKSNKIEVGIKSVIRDIDSDSDYSVQTDQSNLFLYDQDVYAGYFSYNFMLGKFNVVTGVRYEHTDIKGDGDQDVQKFDFNYDNWLPNIAISKTLKGFRTVKVAYSKRIQRPSLFFINPFVNNTDFGNISYGNPFLEPEITDQYELSYNTNILGFTVFSSFYYRHNSSLIESVVAESEEFGGNVVTTYQNVGENKSIGTNIFLTKNIGRVTFRGGGDVYTYNATGVIDGQEVSNEAISYRLFTNGEVALSGTIKADFFGFFQAPRFTLQGENASFSIFGMGIRKDFKNSSIGLRIIEPFAANKFFDSDITNEAAGFKQVSSFGLPFRSIGINFRYKFGKVDFRERQSKIKNTDLKAGESGQGQQGQQQGGGARG
ncbi:MAG: TonB-dependent receptor [Saprospiraceae bacterium]|nr:TonB-dependent receptor [Saprospiraceae bacterium]